MSSLGVENFFSDFESASLLNVRKFGDWDFGIEVQSSYEFGHQGSLEVWFYGGIDMTRVDLDNPGKLRIRVTNEHGNLQFVRPVYSYNQMEWNMVPRWGQEIIDGVLQYTFDVPLDPKKRMIYFATCYPYPYSRTSELVQKLGKLGFVQKSIAGKSVQGRNIYSLVISNPSSEREDLKRVFLSAGFHGGETSGLYALEGILEYLTSDLSQELRQLVEFTVIPMVNVDAQALGLDRRNANGVNLWLDSDAITQPEYLAVVDEIRRTRPQVYLDYHSWHWGGNGGYAPPCIVVGDEIHSKVAALRYHLNRHFPMTTQLLFAESPTSPPVYVAKLLHIPTYTVEHSLSTSTDGTFKESPEIMKQDGVRSLALSHPQFGLAVSSLEEKQWTMAGAGCQIDL